MELILKKSFIKEVAKLPPKVQISIREILEILHKAENFQKLMVENIDIKRMEGQRPSENYYRIRHGSWRVGIEIVETQIIVITVLSRWDIYKKFPPKF